jgi:hypothetical protein
MVPRGGRPISSMQLELLLSPFLGGEAQTETRPALTSGGCKIVFKKWWGTLDGIQISDGEEENRAVLGRL